MILTKVQTPRFWPQWIVAIEVFFLATVIGILGGWTSPYLAKLTKPGDEVLITEEEASWIAAILSLGRIFGAIIGAVIVDFYGSRIALLYTGLPLALGWLLFFFPSSIWFIYLARILGGFGLGMYFSTFPIYMGEISNPKIRGALISLIAQGMPLGNLLGNIAGAYTPMWIFSCLSLVPNIAFLVLFATTPDSSHYLVFRDRTAAAKKSLEWYTRNVDVSSELQSLQEFICQRKSITYRERIGKLLSPNNRKAVILVTIVCIFVQLSGLWSVSFYMEIILRKAGVTVIDPPLIVIIIGILGIIAGWASMYANDKCGRKLMLASSCFGITLSYILLGLNYQFRETIFNTEILSQWLPIFAMVLFQCSLCIGIVPIPSTLMSEMFSPEVKSIALCLANLCSSFFAFLTSKTYQTMVDLTSEQNVFWIYGALNFTLAIYTIVCLPETKGKSLAEIQEVLTHKQRHTNNVKS